ncbi:SDR family oxidoreductase [Patulibacter sp. NPDC049589]|uniref:SDR family NAD(P)-dependent oxidoreductase n=1 Tax=Patulibacter sp. NPDC049589 TaxID=3154731 RepID=UPI003429679C
MTTEELNGKRALVTGGGTGIGVGITECLLSRGATVTIAGRRRDVLDSAAEDFAKRHGDRIRVASCDITDEKSVAEAVRIAGDGVGVDIVVANAGGSGSGGLAPFLLLDQEAWLDVCRLNIVGTANTIREAALDMRGRGGAIVVISSAGSAGPEPCFSHYSASKAAVDMLVQNAAQELGDFGIRVNAVQPGVVPSEIAAEAWDGNEDQYAHILKNTPLGRTGTAIEVGEAVSFLSGPHSEWVTGQIFAVDGGLTIPLVANLQGLARKIHGDEAIDANLGPRLASF